jgi:hypothetical protein
MSLNCIELKDMRASRIRPVFLLFAVVPAILYFGLRPGGYDFTNAVQRLEDRPGLRFDRHGIAYADRLPPIETEEFSIEIAIKPDNRPHRGFNLILLFHGGDDRTQLLMGQWQSQIILMNGDDYRHKRRLPRISFDTSRVNAREMLVTATSGPKGTQIFVNGDLLASKENMMLRVPRKSDGGIRLVIGNSVYGRHSWTGEIYGLALYQDIISEQEIAERFRRWDSKAGFPDDAGGANPDLLYLFDESGDRTIHEHAGRASPLRIPERFTVLKGKFLSFQIVNFDNRRDLIFDICINTFGFIPIGFIFALVLRVAGGRFVRFSLLGAVFAGFLLSLSIETAQAWLPSRHSSALDLSFNTLGTFAGAWAGGKKLELRAPGANGGCSRGRKRSKALD